MIWNKLEKQLPHPLRHVLVGADLNDDGWNYYFVAYHFPSDNSWRLPSILNPIKSHRFNISLNCRERDIWCEIPDVDKSETDYDAPIIEPEIPQKNE